MLFKRRGRLARHMWGIIDRSRRIMNLSFKFYRGVPFVEKIDDDEEKEEDRQIDRGTILNGRDRWNNARLLNLHYIPDINSSWINESIKAAMCHRTLKSKAVIVIVGYTAIWYRSLQRWRKILQCHVALSESIRALMKIESQFYAAYAEQKKYPTIMRIEW